MRQVIPHPADDVDPAELYAADPRPAPPGRPWVLLNMVSSADGATTVDGVSGGLGGPADRQVFAAIRAVADVILVAAGTVRAEHYGPPRPSAKQQARRGARGQTPTARLAICTRSLDLDPTAALFDSTPRPLVYTTDDAPPVRRAALSNRAEIVELPGSSLDMVAVLADLAARGASIVLCEGGPSLNGQLIAAGVVDEFCLTFSPMLASGDSARPAHGPALAAPERLQLDRVLEQDGVLFLRYRRQSDPSD